jgi:hypothetical protein
MMLDALPQPLRDALYVTIGLPIVAVQELDARRHELFDEVDRLAGPVRTRATTLRNQVGDLVPTVQLPSPLVDAWNERLEERVKVLDARMTEVERRLEEALDRVEQQLPEAAAEVMSQARGAARDARTQLRSLVNRAA